MALVKRNAAGHLQKGSNLRAASINKRAGELRAVLENIPGLSPEKTGALLSDIIHGATSIKMARAQKNLQKRGGKGSKFNPEEVSEDSPEIEIKPTFRERIDALHLAWQYMYGKAQANVSIDIESNVTHKMDLSRLTPEQLDQLAELQIKALPEVVDAEFEADDAEKTQG